MMDGMNKMIDIMMNNMYINMYRMMDGMNKMIDIMNKMNE